MWNKQNRFRSIPKEWWCIRYVKPKMPAVWMSEDVNDMRWKKGGKPIWHVICIYSTFTSWNFMIICNKTGKRFLARKRVCLLRSANWIFKYCIIQLYICLSVVNSIIPQRQWNDEMHSLPVSNLFFRFSFTFWFCTSTAHSITFQRPWFKTKAYGICRLLVRVRGGFLKECIRRSQNHSTVHLCPWDLKVGPVYI